MVYSKEDLKSDLDSAVDYFRGRLKQLRAGRARPDTFEHLMVSAYETEMEMKSLANILIENGTSVVITPWDKTVVKEIVKTITDSGLGYSAVDDGDKVRIAIPAMTEETRKLIAKEARGLLEEAKISVRQIRHKFNEQIEKLEGVSEDEQKRGKEAVQLAINSTNELLDKLAEEKEAELLEID